ncbi:ABC-2 family transporter protein [Bacillus toyonensis]|uniref:ABC-2 family transporter protein n=1 Tax=Bacillus toyonensis TaxID=155322 RepID=UPI0015D4F34E
MDFSRYPITIYNKVISFILTFIIPYSFTSFYPAAFFSIRGINGYLCVHHSLLSYYVSFLIASGNMD